MATLQNTAHAGRAATTQQSRLSASRKSDAQDRSAKGARTPRKRDPRIGVERHPDVAEMDIDVWARRAMTANGFGDI